MRRALARPRHQRRQDDVRAAGGGLAVETAPCNHNIAMRSLLHTWTDAQSNTPDMSECTYIHKYAHEHAYIDTKCACSPTCDPPSKSAVE